MNGTLLKKMFAERAASTDRHLEQAATPTPVGATKFARGRAAIQCLWAGRPVGWSNRQRKTLKMMGTLDPEF